MNRKLVGFLLTLLFCVSPLRADLFFVETWDADESGWSGSTAELSVSHSGFGGGSLQGTFAEQIMPGPEVGAFRADGDASGGAYTGDYWAELSTFAGWQFDFYAADVLPSSLYARFSDGQNTYQANLLDQLTVVGEWTTVSTPGLDVGLQAWIGPDGTTGLSNALASVEWMEVRLERNQTIEQDYFMDNFQVIPEPGTLALVLISGLGLAWVRRLHRIAG